MRGLGWRLALAALIAIFVVAAASALATAGAAGPFAGKFELVPLFAKGHVPVIRSGHQLYAERNTISFRTPAGDTVSAFAGSTTDLASIPAAVWPLLPPDGPYAEATALHDPCYASRGTFDWKGPSGVVHHGRSRAQPYSRAECDGILHDAMAALHVPAWKRIAVYEAVRAFGASGFGH